MAPPKFRAQRKKETFLREEHGKAQYNIISVVTCDNQSFSRVLFLKKIRISRLLIKIGFKMMDSTDSTDFECQGRNLTHITQMIDSYVRELTEPEKPRVRFQYCSICL